MNRAHQKLNSIEKKIRLNAMIKLTNSSNEIVDLIMENARKGDREMIKLAASYGLGRPTTQRRTISHPELLGIPVLERSTAITRLVMQGEITLEDAKALGELTGQEIESQQLLVISEFINRVNNGENVAQVAAAMLPRIRAFESEDTLREAIEGSDNVTPLRTISEANTFTFLE